MKPYSEHPNASIAMKSNVELDIVLAKAIAEHKISYVIETGTYDGLGSTSFLASCFSNLTQPKGFVTFEANWSSWRKACRNLARFPFLSPLWGTSVRPTQAADFIANDEMILHPEKYQNIFIDGDDDPLGFYLKECRGELGGRNQLTLRYWWDRFRNYSGENLLEIYLKKWGKQHPLIVLDSCGGIGFLEFQIVVSTLIDDSFLLLLDDIHHLKHYRSLCYVKDNSSFEILGLDEENGWLLANYQS